MEDELAKRRRQPKDPVLRKEILLERGFSESLINLLLWIPEPHQTHWFEELCKMPPSMVVRMNVNNAKMDREMKRHVGSES